MALKRFFVRSRGKRSITLNLKESLHKEILKTLITKSDVLIDPYRPGVLEKMGFSPKECFAINPKLIICRISGYGQTGPLVNQAGHDINYLSYSGLLGLFGRKNENPGFPNNILADFIGGGALGVFGILAAINERNRTGKGQVVDNSMAESSLYVGSNVLNMKRFLIILNFFEFFFLNNLEMDYGIIKEERILTILEHHFIISISAKMENS